MSTFSWPPTSVNNLLKTAAPRWSLPPRRGHAGGELDRDGRRPGLADQDERRKNTSAKRLSLETNFFFNIFVSSF